MKTLLMVDDSATIRNVLKASFGSEFRILEAGDGSAALCIAQTEVIDFFLFDVNMPVMDGITLTGEIRKLEKYRQTPIIILTTETRNARREEGKAAGANGWVLKPCDPDKLLGVIMKML